LPVSFSGLVKHLCRQTVLRKEIRAACTVPQINKAGQQTIARPFSRILFKTKPAYFRSQIIGRYGLKQTVIFHLSFNLFKAQRTVWHDEIGAFFDFLRGLESFTLFETVTVAAVILLIDVGRFGSFQQIIVEKQAFGRFGADSFHGVYFIQFIFDTLFEHLYLLKNTLLEHIHPVQLLNLPVICSAQCGDIFLLYIVLDHQFPQPQKLTTQNTSRQAAEGNYHYPRRKLTSQNASISFIIHHLPLMIIWACPFGSGYRAVSFWAGSGDSNIIGIARPERIHCAYPSRKTRPPRLSTIRRWHPHRPDQPSARRKFAATHRRDVS